MPDRSDEQGILRGGKIFVYHAVGGGFNRVKYADIIEKSPTTKKEIGIRMEERKMTKALLTGNEAVARGAFEAGVRFASAYPGTPSTEILENIAGYKDDILAEWAPNEKVALEAAFGASVAGARSLAAMKHVGVNVAADPLFTIAYTGVNGGLVLITADEPGHFSSQNEQDNRNYAKAAKIALFEPSDSRESKDMLIEAFRVSETYDTPVLFRMTTRVCHGKGIVELADRAEIPFRAYEKNIKKYIPVPAFVTHMRERVEERMKALRDYSEKSPFNFAEYNDTGKGREKTGVIASGISYRYAKEVFGDSVSYLKLGFTNPLPEKLIADFASQFDTLYVIEENDPYIEEKVRMLGFNPKGYDFFPYTGEMTSDVIRKAVFGETKAAIEYDESKVVARPPALCAGCPHRGFFYELGKRKNILMSGDIGCYALAFAEPYNAMDISLCMGASFSMGHGAQQVFDMKPKEKAAEGMRVIACLGDSTFFHTGIGSLINTAYNGSKTISVILDNRITGMTGHQQNPGTGYTLQGKETKDLDIPALVRACGINHIFLVDPNDLAAVKKTLDDAIALDEASAIITRWPCVLKKLSKADKAEFPGVFTDKAKVDTDACIGCKACMKSGCPSLSFNKEAKKATIDPASCVNCGVCGQICPVGAIGKEEN
jgi:indolepyruvate ferredoxin oxidoreductase alpha subunit